MASQHRDEKKKLVPHSVGAKLRVRTFIFRSLISCTVVHPLGYCVSCLHCAVFALCLGGNIWIVVYKPLVANAVVY